MYAAGKRRVVDRLGPRQMALSQIGVRQTIDWMLPPGDSRRQVVSRPKASDTAAVFAESLACLAERIRQLESGGFEAVLDAWRTLSPSSVGARVEITTPTGWTEAVTTGVDRDGALLAKAGGTVRRVVAGEVRWGSAGSRL